MNAKVTECFVCGSPLKQLNETLLQCEKCIVLFELVEYTYRSEFNGGEVFARWIIRDATKHQEE